jgi:hypothetical protein
MDFVTVTDWQKQEWREEAERLRALDPEAQRQVIAIHRATADDPKATRAAAGAQRSGPKRWSSSWLFRARAQL